MSKITIVNKNDKVIGSEQRDIVYQKGLTHRLIRVILINNKDQVLLQWRSANEDTFPETWDQSAGGHVDEGEDYKTAAYRELKEELGIKNIELKLIDKFYTSSEIGKKKISRFNAVFIAKYNGDKITLQKEEVEKVKWFEINDLYNLIQNEHTQFTHGLVSILNQYKQQIFEFTNNAN